MRPGIRTALFTGRYIGLTGLFGALAVSFTALSAGAQQGVKPGDWPQWRGPERTGHSKVTGILKQWPEGGPAQRWKAPGLGGGYGSISVASGKIFGMGYDGAEEVVWSLNEADGKGLWKTKINSANRQVGYPDGSRCTPTYDGARLYVVGVSGDLVCLESATGKVVWQKNFVADFGGQVPHWGYSESPLIDGDRVIATPGGAGAAVVALNKLTGDVAWKAEVPGNDSAHYSSAIKATINGQPQYVQFLSRGIVGLSATEGKLQWRYNSPANGTANISTVLVKDNHVFGATSYRTGGGLARISGAPGAMTATEVYFTREMLNHHGGMILVGDHLYGANERTMTCLDFKTGAIKWTSPNPGKASLTYADGMLIARSEQGPVTLLEANPAAYTEKGVFKQPERTGKNAWSHPVVANGRLYLRDQETLFCYDVKAP